MPPDRSKEARARAEDKFQKSQKLKAESNAAWSQHEADGRAVREKTARLRELRLAKEAADRESAPAPAPKKTAARKKTVKTDAGTTVAKTTKKTGTGKKAGAKLAATPDATPLHPEIRNPGEDV
ncbi:hypothetical protein ACUN0C_02040 [Faunimonas sp. B44]|uniref:hypothetical protein n=1 Tax=Faunimonas sp. B44 TaxID=3461493 RepID=UPI00404458BC